MQGRERELHRRLAEMERRQQGALQGHNETRERRPLAPPVETVGSVASSVGDQGSWSVMMASSSGGDTDDSKTCDSLYDDASVPDDSTAVSTLPSAFTTGLIKLCTVTESKPQDLVEETLELLIKMIGNAITKGQQPVEGGQKYRRVRVSNRRVQKYNIDGAFDVLLSVGFYIREDFEGEKGLSFPLLPPKDNDGDDEDQDERSNDWVPSALDALQAQLAAFKSQTADGDEEPNMDPSEMKRRMRAAALKRQAASNAKTKRRPRESQFSPGLGGGNSKAIYFKGGT